MRPVIGDSPQLTALRLALAEKEAQLEAVLGSARIAYWRYEEATDSCTSSISMSEIWGLLPGQSFEFHARDGQLIHPADVAQHRERIAQARAGASSWRSEFRAIRPRDGRTVWLEERGSARIDPETDGLVLDGLLWEVTERKLAEEILRSSDRRKTFLLNLDDALRALSDPVQIQFEAARMLCRYLGADSAHYQSAEADVQDATAELAGDRPFLVTDAGLSQSISKEARAAYATLGIRAFAAVPVSKDGSLRWTLNVMSSVARDWTADEINLMKDVAERTWAAADRARAQAALRASEERFREFAAASSEILWIRDSRTLQFRFLSRSFEDIFGMPLSRVSGRNGLRRWAKCIDPRDRGRIFRGLARVRKGERVTHEFQIRRPLDGAIRWIRSTCFPFPAGSGSVDAIAGISEDRTQERQDSNRLQVLVDEMQHRTRNQIAVVRALSKMTLAESNSLADFGERFEDRLAALARAQRLLSNLADGGRVTFDDLLRTELHAHGVSGSRLYLEGPSGVRLRSGSVQTLALALHELATNSIKYGAIGSATGRLRVGWHVIPATDGQGDRLCIDWVESGAQVDGLTAPQRGYGRELIETALPYQLNARTRYDIGPEGLHCQIDLPISGAPGRPNIAD